MCPPSVDISSGRPAPAIGRARLDVDRTQSHTPALTADDELGGHDRMKV
jgi:hypothetical protein